MVTHPGLVLVETRNVASPSHAMCSDIFASTPAYHNASPLSRCVCGDIYHQQGPPSEKWPQECSGWRYLRSCDRSLYGDTEYFLRRHPGLVSSSVGSDWPGPREERWAQSKFHRSVILQHAAVIGVDIFMDTPGSETVIRHQLRSREQQSWFSSPRRLGSFSPCSGEHNVTVLERLHDRR